MKEWYGEIDTALWDNPPFPESRVKHFLRPIERMLEHGIKLVVTKIGVVGLAPAGTQTDDQVCFIDGCSVPVVLRSRSDGFEVIGEAWFPASNDTDTMVPSQSRKAMHKMGLV